MKVPQSSLRLNTNKKEEQKALHTMAHGWNSRISLPEFMKILPGAIIVQGYSIVNGSNEFFINIESENIDLKSKIRIAEPGIVIEKGTVNDEELRLPWQAMIKAHPKGNSILVDLIHDKTLKFSGIPIFRDIKFSLKFLSSFINEKIEKYNK